MSIRNLLSMCDEKIINLFIKTFSNFETGERVLINRKKKIEE